MISTRRIDAMLVRDDLPELGSNLVATLAGLKVDNFSHFENYSLDFYVLGHVSTNCGTFVGAAADCNRSPVGVRAYSTQL